MVSKETLPSPWTWPCYYSRAAGRLPVRLLLFSGDNNFCDINTVVAS